MTEMRVGHGSHDRPAVGIHPNSMRPMPTLFTPQASGLTRQMLPTHPLLLRVHFAHSPRSRHCGCNDMNASALVSVTAPVFIVLYII